MKNDRIEGILGMNGRMITGSKSSYCQKYPDNLVVFNANICTDEGKVWFGDLDITRDSEKLKDVAISLNRKIYILREYDARFENERSPVLERAVATFEP